MFDVDLGSSIDLNISLAHPWSSETYPSSAKKIGAAASLREARKKAKYDQLKLLNIQRYIPLVLEHFGTWGEQGRKFLKKLSNQSSDETEDQILQNFWIIGENAIPSSSVFSPEILKGRAEYCVKWAFPQCHAQCWLKLYICYRSMRPSSVQIWLCQKF